SAADGASALAEIRERRPDIAVVDLNLPVIHGIELVRRVRAASMGTKIIVIAGSADDELVREVIRAGGDGYLLKNGPARHLVDAIAYVSDGGQYFSPQLRRDGRDRHLLEEPPRHGPFSEPAAEAEPEAARADSTGRTVRGRRGRRPSTAVNDAMNLRQRIREGASPDLEDRDYEIMTRMADGIRPILDRLDEIDTRVAQMEHGDAPLPSDPRGWLSRQLADSLDDPRTGSDVAVTGRNVNNLEARLPEMIEMAVTKRFHQMAGKLQQEIEETHVRTLETFVKNIQAKLVQRISALEHDMSKQAETMSQLREDSQRTEDNLSRLISGVDKLARELPRRLAAATEPGSEAQAAGSAVAADPERAAALPKPTARKRSGSRHNRTVKIVWATVPAVILVGLLAWATLSLENRGAGPNDSAATPVPAAEKFKAPSTSADTKTRMQAAQECVDRKDYAVAEDLYKQIVKSEPGNVEALKGLASVLYREDKIEESAEILDKLSKN
ncbi:MAG: response regulator, partial [Acidobacteriota bacterium]